MIGILEGSDPALKSETIVIGAHYDHLGHGGAGSLAPKEGEIHHGADDNASGVAGVSSWRVSSRRKIHGPAARLCLQPSAVKKKACSAQTIT